MQYFDINHRPSSGVTCMKETCKNFEITFDTVRAIASVGPGSLVPLLKKSWPSGWPRIVYEKVQKLVFSKEIDWFTLKKLKMHKLHGYLTLAIIPIPI